MSQLKHNDSLEETDDTYYFIFNFFFVVSTKIWHSFARCSIVKCISFLFLWRHSCCKKVPVEKESELSRGGAITFLTLFHQNHIYTKSSGKSRFSLSFLSSTVIDIRRKPYMVRIHLTIEKRAKRMPDFTVKTTFFQVIKLCSFWKILSVAIVKF